MGSATFPCTQDTVEYGAEISKGTTKAVQDWTLEDTTAPENAPTNAFIEGDGCPQRMWLLLVLQTSAAHQSSSHANRLPLPAAWLLQNHSWWTGKGQASSAADGHFFGSEAERDSPVCSTNDLPTCRETVFPAHTIPDSSVMPGGLQLPTPPPLENVSAAGVTQCQVPEPRALELPPGRDWIVTAGPWPFRPADWRDRSQRSTAGSSWWPPSCQRRSPRRWECTDPFSRCAGSGTNCRQWRS